MRTVHSSLAGRRTAEPTPRPCRSCSSGSVPSLAGWPSPLLNDKAWPPAFPGVPVTGTEREPHLHHQLAFRGQLRSNVTQRFSGVRAALRPPGGGGAGRPCLALGRSLQVLLPRPKGDGPHQGWWGAVPSPPPPRPHRPFSCRAGCCRTVPRKVPQTVFRKTKADGFGFPPTEPAARGRLSFTSLLRLRR